MGERSPSRRDVLGTACGVAGLLGAAPVHARSAESTPEPGTGDHLWTIEDLGIDIDTKVVDGTLIAQGGPVSPLQAVDHRTGEVTWTFPRETFHYAENDGLFGALTDEEFVALSPDDGSVRWRAPVDIPVEDWVVDDGVAYFHPQHGYVVAVSTDDGTVKWQLETDRSIDELVTAPGNVVLVPQTYAVSVHDADDGSVRWEQQLVGDPVPQWRLDGDVVYLNDHPSSVRARATADGAEQWHYESEEADNVLWFSVDDDRIYLEEVGRGVTAVDTRNGSVVWHHPAEVPGSSTLLYEAGALGPAGEVLYFVTERNDVLALDAASGVRRWRTELDVAGEMSNHEFFHGDGTYVRIDRTDRDALLRLDGGDGGPRWRRTFEGSIAEVWEPSAEHLLVEVEDTLHLDPETGAERWRQPGLAEFTTDREGTPGLLYGIERVDGREVTLFTRPVEGEWAWTSTYELPRTPDDVEFHHVEETLVVTHPKQGTVLAFDWNVPASPRFDVSPTEPDPGDTVTFDATSTVDAEGATEALAFHWDFGDGGTASGRTADHVYESPGWYEVTLTVTDTDGDESSTTAPVPVGGATEPPDSTSVPGFGPLAAGLAAGTVVAWLARDES